MAFQDSDKYRILKNLPGESLATVEAAIASISNELHIAEIQGVLDSLDMLSYTISSSRNSDDHALIRADVLEWSEGARSQGMLQERFELRGQLASLLGISWCVLSGGYSGSGSLEYLPI